MAIQGPRILGALLVEHEDVAPEALEAALGGERIGRERVGETLVRIGATTPEAVVRCLAIQLGLRVAEAPLAAESDALEAVRPDLMRTHRLVPLSLTSRSIRVAMADPLDLGAIDDVQFQTGRRVEPLVATADAVARAIERLNPPREAGRDGSLDDGPVGPPRKGGRVAGARADRRTAEGRALAAAARRHGTAALVTRSGPDVSSLVEALPDALRAAPPRDEHLDPDLERATRRAPIVRLVDGILRGAIDDGASDIHVEETGRDVRVRLRIDGRLHPTVDIPAGARRAVLSRIKVLAGMDISVRRRAQDGRISFQHDRRRLTLRVSTLPVNGGEKAVVRVLDSESAPSNLGVLGMGASDLRQLRLLLALGEGVILAAGPTGSGKSTTLFAALSEIDRDARNVVTVEDPVEYRLAGASQVQVDRRAGLGFAAALRAILRQDPDVVMVGEIRDRETAEIAMAAAVTGHLVLSTIHTTDAPSAVTRLLHMGVPPFLVAGGLAGVVAQRLVRRSCPRCRARGCSECRDGLRGRTGLYQVLRVSDSMRDEISTGGSSARLRRLAAEIGMKSLESDARRAVAAGLTTPHEVSRYLAARAGAGVPCPRCSHSVPFGALACPRCGRRNGRRCPCGRPLERGWRYCPDCIRPVAAA